MILRLIVSVITLFLLPPSVHPETEAVRNLSNRRYLEETLQAIRSAKESIFLVMYHFPLDPSNKYSPVTRLADALIEAKRRGVTLQVILDQEIRADRSNQGAPMKNLRAYHFFKENGASVSFDSLTKRTHAKLLVIDREVVILGSTNWSREALDENYEANLWVRSPEMAQEIFEEFKAIEGLQPERIPVTQGSLRIARSFLLDKNQGSRLIEGDAQRALRLYLLLLSKRNAGTSVIVDYEEAAKRLGIAESMSREAYRRQIIKVLRKLEREYKLLQFQPRYGKDAEVTLPEIPQENYFELPRDLVEGVWLTKLSSRALYALLILYDQWSYPRSTPAIRVALETLEKRYFLTRGTLGLGLRELARQDLVEIYYGRSIDFEKREFETASYVLLPPYDPKVRDEKLRELEGLYGKHAFEETREYARAFFKERDPEVIQTILGLRLTYSPEWVGLAMKEIILKKSVGNPARSLPYLIGILKQWKEKGAPTLKGSLPPAD